MSIAYDNCVNDAAIYQNELNNKLQNEQSNDVFTYFESVARGFPSTAANPHSFDIPLIDLEALRLWAKEKGWGVKFAPEKSAINDSRMPPVRFTKIT